MSPCRCLCRRRRPPVGSTAFTCPSRWAPRRSPPRWRRSWASLHQPHQPQRQAPAPVAAVAAVLVLEGEEARHAARALRLAAGDRVELCDGRGNVAVGVVTGTDKQRVWVSAHMILGLTTRPEDGAAGPTGHVSTEGAASHQRWSGPRWVLAVACTTLKGGRAEWLVEKATELGAFMLVPLVTERSQAGGKAKFRTSRSGGGGGGGGSDLDWGSDGGGGDDYQPGRLERVAIAATKQSLRPHALALVPPTPLADLLPLVRRAAAGEGGEAAAASRAAGGAGGGGEGSVVGGVTQPGFSLVAVAGAPPLMSVLQQLRSGSGVGASTDPGGCADSNPVAEAPPSASSPAGQGGAAAAASAAAAAAAAAAAVASNSPVRVLFVGPEGDFTPAELAALVEAGAQPVGLGVNRLRTETAAIGLLSACLFSD
eukprot:XP_001703273.1 hypothetical protein CHLREDRAFT_205517 [Chlamydomonas reinhardtii]